jgi:hypothetical protein
MTRTASGCLLALAILSSLGARPTHAADAASHKPAAHPRPELEAAAQKTVEKGFHVDLPPHISTLLGLTNEQNCAVLQGVVRSTQEIQGIDVLEQNHQDIVLFVVDTSTNDQTFYLTSPTGGLRRLLAVRQGVGQVVKPAKADVEAFNKEKKMWEERVAAQTAAR